MDFDLTDEHKMIRDMARDFADEVINEYVEFPGLEAAAGQIG